MIVQPRTTWLGWSISRINHERKEWDKSPLWIRRMFGTDASIPHEELATIKTIGCTAGEIAFECEVVQPPSGRFKAVTVHVPAEQVLPLLKLCRSAAAAQRNKGMVT